MHDLKQKLAKYEQRLKNMVKEWSATKPGSRYGDEYLESQIRVYEAAIEEIRRELDKKKKDLEN